MTPSSIAPLLAGVIIAFVWHDELTLAGERLGWAIGRWLCRAILNVDIGDRDDEAHY